MKKRLLLLVLSTILLVNNKSFAYTPTEQDNRIISSFQAKLSTILTPAAPQNIIIASQVATIRQKYKQNKKIFYLF